MDDAAIWEIRFEGERGASVYTAADISDDIAKANVARTVQAAALVFDRDSVEDASRCLSDGLVVDVVMNMRAVLYAIRHERESVP